MWGIVERTMGRENTIYNRLLAAAKRITESSNHMTRLTFVNPLSRGYIDGMSKSEETIILYLVMYSRE